MTNKRLSRLDQLMASNHLDALVLNPGSTLTYLTGLHFHLMERPTVFLYVRGSEPVLILPELEAGKLSSATTPIKPVTFGDDPSEWVTQFSKTINDLKLKGVDLGVEPTHLRFLEMDLIQKTGANNRFVSAENILADLRMQKDEDEISKMRTAVQIAQNALKATIPSIKVGISEIEIASELIIQTYKAGSSPELPFSPIVASGPNSANPHAVPTNRRLERGDLVVIDWGAGFEDYFSDLTRTFAITQVSQELKKIYDTVQAANAAGRAAGKPDKIAGVVDNAARKIIDAAGYGKYFTHRTGHGLGMESHESPYMFSANTLRLAQGMVYTVEPGIYIPGVGGVRIEDDIVVTCDQSESLSDFPRDLQIIQ